MDRTAVTPGHAATNRSCLSQSLRLSSRVIKHLIFNVNEVEYGIPLSDVKEVISMGQITPVPNLPEYCKGILNLRGDVIAIIDLRRKFSLPSRPFQKQKTCIIISEVNQLTLGTIVDDVVDVRGFDQRQVRGHVDICNHADRQYIKGIATVNNGAMVMLLDSNKLLNPLELGLISRQLGQLPPSPNSVSSEASYVR